MVVRRRLIFAWQDAVSKHESAGTFSSPEYQAAVAEYNKHLTLRLHSIPEEVVKTFTSLAKDPTVNHTM